MARSKSGKSGKAAKPERGAPAAPPEAPSPAPEAPPDEDAPMENAGLRPAEQALDPPPDDPWERFAVEDLRAYDEGGDDAPAGRAFAPPAAPADPIPALVPSPAADVRAGPSAGGEVSFPTQEAFEQAGPSPLKAEEVTLDLLCFRVADEEFAIDIQRVWEIIRPRPVTELPRVPDFVSGIISLRGQIVPVMDLRARLGFPPPAEPISSAKIIVATYEGRPIGMTVDAVSQKVRVPGSGMDAPPSVLGAQESGFLRGVCRHQGRLFAVLNADAVLAFDVGALGSTAVSVEDRSTRGEAP